MLLAECLLVVGELRERGNHCMVTNRLLRRMGERLRCHKRPSSVDLEALRQSVTSIYRLKFPVRRGRGCNCYLRTSRPMFFAGARRVLLGFSLLGTVGDRDTSGQCVLTRRRHPMNDRRVPLLVSTVHGRRPVGFSCALIERGSGMVYIGTRPRFLGRSGRQ